MPSLPGVMLWRITTSMLCRRHGYNRCSMHSVGDDYMFLVYVSRDAEHPFSSARPRCLCLVRVPPSYVGIEVLIVPGNPGHYLHSFQQPYYVSPMHMMAYIYTPTAIVPFMGVYVRLRLPFVVTVPTMKSYVHVCA